MKRDITRLSLAVLALGAAVGLGACQGPNAQMIQARAEARGTATPLPRMEDWGFGMRSQTPGYVFDRGGSA
jgi:hypothetical protein